MATLRPEAPVMGARTIVFWAISGVLAMIGFFTANGLLTTVAVMIPPLLVSLVWRRGEPPVLLFGCMFQWLQATAAIFYTNQLGISLDEAFGSNRLSIATWLSMIAVVFLAFGIRAVRTSKVSRQVELEGDAARMDIKKIAVLYVLSAIISGALANFAWLFPSITQPLLAVAALKWAFVFLLCYCVLQQRQHYGLLIACVLVEFASGLFGVFANFKSVFFVLAIAAMSSALAFRGRRLAASVICFVILFVLGVIWSAVKMDYRAFLNEQVSGSDEAVPIEQRVNKLADLLDSITLENISDGIDAMVLRVSYVSLFALAVENVPARVPFENGELWKGAVIHVLTPRFLFPDKPALDDSERTREYTGINVSGMESGTSIGIGYVGESYIDFGPFWMFVPILLLGCLYGLIYRFFVIKSRYPLIGASLGVSCLLFNCYAMETSNIKMVGGVMASALVSIVVYFLFGSALTTFLRRTPQFADAWSKGRSVAQRGLAA